MPPLDSLSGLCTSIVDQLDEDTSHMDVSFVLPVIWSGPAPSYEEVATSNLPREVFMPSAFETELLLPVVSLGVRPRRQLN